MSEAEQEMTLSRNVQLFCLRQLPDLSDDLIIELYFLFRFQLRSPGPLFFH